MIKLIFFCFVISSIGHAKISIKKIVETQNANSSKITIYYDGSLKSNPGLQKLENHLVLTIPDVIKVDEGKTFFKNSKSVETKVVGEKFHLDAFIKGVHQNPNRVSLVVKKGEIGLSFPGKTAVQEVNKIVQIPKKNPEVEVKKTKETIPVVERENLDYLVENLRKEENQSSQNSQDDFFELDQTTTDEVKVKESSVLAAPVAGKDDFSFTYYALKIVTVLAILLGSFFLIANVFRKKVMKSGQLSLLGGAKLIEVVGTTHLSPKRKILLVKAHDQFLLLSSSENGINYLTEIKDPVGLVRMSEQDTHGGSFDQNLDLKNQDTKLEQKVTLKDTNKLYESRNKKSISDHLKKRVKKMKGFEAQA